MSRLVHAATVLVLILLHGCAPVISKETLKTVDRKAEFKDIVKNPEEFKGRKVVLGGTIIGTQNLENRTLVEVFQEGLNFRLIPSVPEESEGRFIIEYPGFRDPAVYSKGAKITVAGTVKGVEPKKLGETTYKYPVIDPVETRLMPPAPYQGTPQVGIGIGLGYTHID